MSFNKIIFRGKGYDTLFECYEDNKELAAVRIETFRQRIRNGFSVEEALTSPKQNTSSGSHIVEGAIFESLPAIARAYQMTTNAVFKRYSRGFRGDDLVPENKRKNYVAPEKEIKTPQKLKFEAGGKKYRSASKACEELGVNYVTYRARLRKGLTKEEALELVPKQDKRFRKKTYVVQNENLTVDELSKKFEVPVHIIRDRLNRNASIAQAIGLKEIKKGDLITQSESRKNSKRKINRIKLEVDGKTYKTYKELAEAYSLPEYVVRQRIKNFNYSVEEAVKLKGKGKEVIVKGIKYKSLADAARAYGITLPILLGRLKGNLTLEQALRLEEYDTAYSVEFEGEKYKNLVHLAEENGISANTLRARLASGKTLKQSIKAGERIKNKGRFIEATFQKNVQLGDKDGVLYFVKISLNGKKFYKVGITTNSVTKRIKNIRFKHDIICKFNGKLSDLSKIKQKILLLTEERKSKTFPDSNFDGYTEILELTDKEAELAELLLKKCFSDI